MPRRSRMVVPMPTDPSNPATPRVSAKALWGSLMSVVSVAVCVLAAIAAMLVSPAVAAVVLILPLVGGAGAVLCVLALREIDRGGGAIVGKPIAIVGLLIGLVSAILQGAAALSAVGSAYAVKANLVPVVESFVLAEARGDRSAMRACLGETVSHHLDDARIDWFFHELRSRQGTLKGADFGLGFMLRAADQLRAAAAGTTAGATVIENPRPIELLFDRGSAVAFVMPDEEAMRASNRIAIGDMIVLMPDSSVIALRENGPGEALATRLGWRVIKKE